MSPSPPALPSPPSRFFDPVIELLRPHDLIEVERIRFRRGSLSTDDCRHRSAVRTEDERRPSFRAGGITARHKDLVLNRSCAQKCLPSFCTARRPSCRDYQKIHAAEGKRPDELGETEIEANDDADPNTMSADGCAEHFRPATGNKIPVISRRAEEMDLVIAMNAFAVLKGQRCIGAPRATALEANRAGHDHGVVSRRRFANRFQVRIVFSMCCLPLPDGGIAAVDEFRHDNDIRREPAALVDRCRARQERNLDVHRVSLEKKYPGRARPGRPDLRRTNLLMCSCAACGNAATRYKPHPANGPKRCALHDRVEAALDHEAGPGPGIRLQTLLTLWACRPLGPFSTSN